MPDQPAPPPVSAPEAGQFFLEIAGLIGVARLGWTIAGGGLMGLSLAALFVAVAGALWALFRARGYVPNGADPVIAVPGPLRLGIELGVLAAGAAGLWLSGWGIAAVVFALGVIVIYALLGERTMGLLRNAPSPGR